MEKREVSNNTKMSNARIRTFKLISIGFSLFISLFVCEIGARIYYFGLEGMSYDKINSFIPIGLSGFLRAAESKQVLYELKPGIDDLFKLKRFQTNSNGNRDKEYPLTKPPKTIRGLVIGDSFTMGSGVEIENVYHSVVEQTLNNQSEDISYELINFGVGGYNLLNYLGILEDKALRYDPDFILIGYCAFNDYLIPGEQHYRGDFKAKVKEMAIKPFYTSYLAGFIERALGSNSGSKMFNVLPENEAFIDDVFGQFSAFSKKHNIPIVISAISMLEDNGNMAKVEAIAECYDLPLTNSFRKIDFKELTSYTISRLDHHPNARAHKLYADDILSFDKFQEVLEERKLLLNQATVE